MEIGPLLLLVLSFCEHLRQCLVSNSVIIESESQGSSCNTRHGLGIAASEKSAVMLVYSDVYSFQGESSGIKISNKHD